MDPPPSWVAVPNARTPPPKKKAFSTIAAAGSAQSNATAALVQEKCLGKPC